MSGPGRVLVHALLPNLLPTEPSARDVSRAPKIVSWPGARGEGRAGVRLQGRWEGHILRREITRSFIVASQSKILIWRIHDR